MKIAITGHRPNKLGNDYDFKSELSRKIINELQIVINEYKPTKLISGMALGIDTMWSVLAIKNNIPFIAAIPCKNQYHRWFQKSITLYKRIIEDPLCTVVNVSVGSYTNHCMQKRNEYMVNECDILIAVWDGTNGGTSNCVSYARKVNKKIILINPNNL